MYVQFCIYIYVYIHMYICACVCVQYMLKLFVFRGKRWAKGRLAKSRSLVPLHLTELMIWHWTSRAYKPAFQNSSCRRFTIFIGKKIRVAVKSAAGSATTAIPATWRYQPPSERFLHPKASLQQPIRLAIFPCWQPS